MIDTASVSVVDVDRGRARVLLVNDTGGLDRFGAAPSAPWEAAGRDGSGTKVRG